MTPPHVMFIHGMFLNGLSWQSWTERFTAAGYSCDAPSWPYHEGDPPNLRKTIDPALGRLTFGAVVDHLKGLIDAVPERPFLVGHSIGGLLVQKLVNDGYARAAVTIGSAPPPGLTSFSPYFIKGNFPHVNPLAGNGPTLMSPARFHEVFANTVSRATSDEAYERLAVPESRNVPRSTLGSQAKVSFKAARAPMLFIGAGDDHLTPPSMNRRNALKYKAGPHQVEYQEFAGRSHYICGEEGWEEVADAAHDWFTKQG